MTYGESRETLDSKQRSFDDASLGTHIVESNLDLRRTLPICSVQNNEIYDLEVFSI